MGYFLKMEKQTCYLKKHKENFRFVQETRTVHDDEQSDNSSERYREEGEQHVVYAPQYRV